MAIIEKKTLMVLSQIAISEAYGILYVKLTARDRNHMLF